MRQSLPILLLGLTILLSSCSKRPGEEERVGYDGIFIPTTAVTGTSQQQGVYVVTFSRSFDLEVNVYLVENGVEKTIFTGTAKKRSHTDRPVITISTHKDPAEAPARLYLQLGRGEYEFFTIPKNTIMDIPWRRSAATLRDNNIVYLCGFLPKHRDKNLWYQEGGAQSLEDVKEISANTGLPLFAVEVISPYAKQAAD